MNELSINIIQQQWKNRTYSTCIGVVKYRYMINLGEIKLPTLMQWGDGGGGGVGGGSMVFNARGVSTDNSAYGKHQNCVLHLLFINNLN